MASIDAESGRLVVWVVHDASDLAFLPHPTGSQCAEGDGGDRVDDVDGGQLDGRPLRLRHLTPTSALSREQRNARYRLADVIAVTLREPPGVDWFEPLTEGGGPRAPVLLQILGRESVVADPLGMILGGCPLVVADHFTTASPASLREVGFRALRLVLDRLRNDALHHGVASDPGAPEPAPPVRPERMTSPASRRWRSTLDGLPPLPELRAADDDLWPAALARQALNEAFGVDPIWHRGAAGSHGLSDGSGSPTVVVLQFGDWCFKTSPRRAFKTSQEARACAKTLRERKLLLGDLMPPSTVIAVGHTDGDDEAPHWVWTISPWVQTLRAEMNAAAEAGDDATLADRLGRFAAAAVASVGRAAVDEMALDVHPSNFAETVEGQLIYLDDDVFRSPELPMLGHALLRRFSEYADYPVALEAYQRRLLELVAARLRPEAVRRVALVESLEAAVVVDAPATKARDALLHAVQLKARGR